MHSWVVSGLVIERAASASPFEVRYGFCRAGIRNPRDTGTPIGPLDDSALPAAERARADFDSAMAAYDHDLAQCVIVSFYRQVGIDAVLEVLCVWASRNVIFNGQLLR